MKLYYSKGACSLAVRILIHEIGIHCQFEAVNLQTKQTETGTNFLKINPKGAVPALLLDDNSVLTENAVIQQYLADTNKANELLPPVGNNKRYHVLEWLNFVSTELHKGCSPFFNPNIPTDLKNTLFKKNLERQLHFTDAHLQQNKYLAGETFTLADIYLFVVLIWLPHIGINLADYPHLERHFNNLSNKKSIQKALTEEGLDLVTA